MTNYRKARLAGRIMWRQLKSPSESRTSGFLPVDVGAVLTVVDIICRKFQVSH
jgi:hypothetical protein